LVEDEQWRHIALAERRGGVGKIPPSFASHFKQAGQVNGVVRASLSPALHATCAAMPGPGDGETAPGYVTLFTRTKPGAPQAAALRIIASAAGVECLRRGAGRSQVRRVFWERYLAGGFADSGALRDDAAAAGVQLPASYLGAVFDVEGALPNIARDAVAQALAPTEAVCPPVAMPPGQVLALIPVRHAADVARARQAATNAVRDVPAQAAARSMTCGIGGYRADILEGPASVEEARRALSLGRRLHGRGSVTLYSDLGVYALLHAGADREAFARFAEAQIAPLEAYDRKHKTDLLKTLRLYFEIGENVKEAAERLSVHRHTIFYRLNQISQILKVDLRLPRDQLTLRAALAIRQMESEEE
jgi:DNA-binding PucR family transcriptional regulator